MMTKTDEKLMHIALDLALRGKGNTKTNPIVGCVIEKNGKIIGQGFHKQFGGPHAEVFALKQAGKNAKGATAYVTLEPCIYFEGKKTPPCTNRLIAAGLKRVVIATKDPNKKVAGKGISLLIKNGIKVDVGILEKDAQDQIAPYRKSILTRKPYVFLKVAVSLDGLISKKGKKYISSKKWLKFVHKLRSESDAILVGIGTVLADDPTLTTRLVRGKDPLRVILDSKLEISLNAKVLADKNVLIVGSKKDANKAKLKLFLEKQIPILLLNSKHGQIDWNSLLLELGKRNIGTLMIEGGSKIIASAFNAKIIDKCYFGVVLEEFGNGVPLYGSPLNKRVDFKIIQTKKYGKDVLVEAIPKYS